MKDIFAFIVIWISVQRKQGFGNLESGVDTFVLAKSCVYRHRPLSH
jgi:hypothetical protein